jgi:hypothetical protein
VDVVELVEDAVEDNLVLDEEVVVRMVEEELDKVVVVKNVVDELDEVVTSETETKEAREELKPKNPPNSESGVKKNTKPEANAITRNKLKTIKKNLLRSIDNKNNNKRSIKSAATENQLI